MTNRIIFNVRIFDDFRAKLAAIGIVEAGSITQIIRDFLRPMKFIENLWSTNKSVHSLRHYHSDDTFLNLNTCTDSQRTTYIAESSIVVPKLSPLHARKDRDS